MYVIVMQRQESGIVTTQIAAMEFYSCKSISEHASSAQTKADGWGGG